MSELIIKDWELGIGDSPYKGFSQMRNVDIFSAPGALKISQKLSRVDGGVVTGLILWWAINPVNGVVYGVDELGVLYSYFGGFSIITGHGTANAEGNGLAIWKGYLFYARREKLDVMNLTTGTWTNDWQTLENTDFHPMMAGQDDFLYVGDKQYIDTFNEATPPFDPTNPASYTPNLKDLELRSDYKITTLEQWGSEIVIGTFVGINNTINLADMFFWDGTSDSFSLNKTVRFADNGVWQIKNDGNTLYVVAGTGRTRLFASATSQGIEIKRFNNININPASSLDPKQGAIDLFNGELILGVGRSNGGGETNASLGVYSYRKGAYVLRNIISTGQSGEVSTLQIGAIIVHTPEHFLVSYYDIASNQHGVDELVNTFYTEYKAEVESPIYQVAHDLDPITYERCEIILGKAIRSGDRIKITARESLTDTYVLLTEFTATGAFADNVGKTVMDQKVQNLGSIENIQCKISLDTSESTDESPELIQIRLHN